MGDVIKRALEKATSIRVKGRRADASAWDDAMRDTAEEIAVFLNALPSHQMRQALGGGTYSPDATTTKKLAAAVTRAAEDRE